MLNAIATDLQGIYVVSAEGGYPSKIGITADPVTRLSQLQIGNWSKLSLNDYRYVLAPGMSPGERVGYLNQIRAAAVMLERKTHETLRGMDLGLHGEWFDITKDEAIAVVDKVAGKNGCSLIDLDKIAEFDFESIQWSVELHSFKALLEQSVAAKRLINAA